MLNPSQITVNAALGAVAITSIMPGDAGFNIEYGNSAYSAAKRWGVWVGDDGRYHLDSADAFIYVATAAGDVTFAHSIFASDGVKITGSNGAMTLLGAGDGTDEDLTYNFNSANVVGVSSSTGVTKIDNGNIITQGKFNSSDGTAGLTQTCSSTVTAVTVKDGLITAITCP